MGVLKSVRFKIFIVFVLVIIPLVGLLIYNNIYSNDIVKKQISQNYSVQLMQYSNEVDNILKQFDYFLFQLSTDSDIIYMQMYDYGSDEYVLAKQRLSNKLLKEESKFQIIDAYFVYSKTYDDIVIIYQKNDGYTERLQVVRTALANSDRNVPEKPTVKWNVAISESNQAFLIKTMDLSGGLFGGILVGANSLAEPLSKWDLGNEGGVAIASPDKQPLTSRYFATDRYENIKGEFSLNKRSYQMVRASGNSGPYLLINQMSSRADIYYLLIIQEKKLLQNLPYLQSYIYLMLLVGIIAFSVYLLYLKRILFKPLSFLLHGMKDIEDGNIAMQLGGDRSNEFSYLMSGFNSMSSKIYEEKIKLQQAELKYLQMQINPHFYMNTLNIIYNFAAMKDTGSVQKMTLYLADYFRFIMRSERSTITINEEANHVRNYLDIQVLRYPDQLTYDIHIPQEYFRFEIPPLTLQPFVENAIIHGFTKSHGIFHIEITAFGGESCLSDYFIVSITDNGKGLSPEMLENLNSEQYMESLGEKHLGIWNVRHRLRMHFGPRVHISFQNRIEGGACVSISFPLEFIKKEGKNA